MSSSAMDGRSADILAEFTVADDLRDEEVRALYEQLRSEYQILGTRHERLLSAVADVLMGQGTPGSLGEAFAADDAPPRDPR